MSRLLLKFSLLLLAHFFVQASFAQEAQFPIVKGHGGVYNIPQATEYPSHEVLYKIVVDVKTGAADPAELNPALHNLARMANLHGLGGVTKENLKVIAVVHGGATTAILSEAAYERRFNAKNPNASLIKSLDDAGIKLFVCGQSLIARKIEPDELAPGIGVSLSAVTLLSTYQLDGYAVISF